MKRPVEKILWEIYFLLRRTVYSFLLAVNFLTGGRKSEILVVCYHSIADDDWRFSVPFERFREQINFLTSNYHPITPEDLYWFLKGERSITLPAFILCFDDGYKDIYQVKDYLKALGLKATAFVLSDPQRANRQELGTNKDFLTDEELGELIKAGWTIGSHGATHRDFFSLTPEEEIEEIISSKNELEERLGIKVNYFAYPKGRFSPSTVETVKQAGYLLGFTMDSCLLPPDGTKLSRRLFTLPRVGLDRRHSFIEFRAVLSPLVIGLKNIFLRTFGNGRRGKAFLSLKDFSGAWAKKFFLTAFTLFCLLVYFLAIRGIGGVPQSSELVEKKWTEKGPFELSPERGRFALLYSILEDRSFYFSSDLASFSEPDVAVTDGKFVSLFPPGLSFLAIPGYLLGKFLGISVVGTTAVISLFALGNLFLIRSISVKMGAHPALALLGSLAFAFGSPAFTYAVSFYQHHLSLFLILAAVYLLMTKDRFWSRALTWLVLGVAILVDYPNGVMFLPIALSLFRRLLAVREKGKDWVVSFKISGALALGAILLPCLALLWFNYQSYGSPLQTSGTLERTIEINRPGSGTEKSLLGFFRSRNMLNGFLVHFLSQDRGIIYYAPVVLLGLGGLLAAYRRGIPYTGLLVGLSGANILLYSMWSDPWGGWAFGSRYLIPTYAVLAIFLSLGLTYFSKNKWLFFLFWPLFCYSVGINTLGAITSSKNPPKVEVLALEKISGKEEKYTFSRNFDYLATDGSKSFVYQSWAKKYLTPPAYYRLLLGLIILGAGGIFVYYLVSPKDYDSS